MAGRDTVENVDVTLNVKDKASKPIDAVADRLEGLDDVEVELGVDDKATKPVADIEKRIDALEAETTLVDVEDSGVADVLRDLADIKTAADKADDADATIKVEVDGATKAKGDLDDIAKKGEGLTGGAVNALSDLTGPLGDVSGKVGEMGQAFVGAAELAAPALDRMGIDVGKFAGLLGVGGVALGAVIYFWNTFVGGADQAKDKLAEVQEAMAAGDFAAAAKGITKALQPWRKTMDDVGLSVSEATKFITGQTDVLPLNADAVKDATSQQHFLAAELERQRKFWTDNHGDLEQAQTDQFLATKAIGGTTEAFLAQAKTALPEVQKQILAYVAMVNGIPQERFTEITTDTDPNDVAQVEAELNNLARDREALITAGIKFDENTKKRLSDLGVPLMAGTPYAAGGVYRVGEAGPETVVLPRGARVDRAAVTARARGDGVTIVNNYVTVNVPLGTPTPEVGRYVADALDSHERRTGSRRRARA